MASDYLPPNSEVLRYVPWARLAKDDDDNPVGITPGAFRLRPEEEYLSATSTARFEGTLIERRHSAVHAIRSSEIDVRPKAGFAIGIVSEIDDACRLRKRRVRFIFEPTDDNPAHAALRQWPDQDLELMERLASIEWSNLLLNREVS